MSDYEKPSRAEDEYFVREELERRKKWAKERAAEMAKEEREKLKQLHWMRCPKDGMELQTTELQGVRIDSCGLCHGMWLDAGELEQLLNPSRPDLVTRVLSVFKR
jgi:hypothetical protein